jgi:hypothetical protein
VARFLRTRLCRWLGCSQPLAIELVPVVVPDNSAVVFHVPVLLTAEQRVSMREQLLAWASPRGIKVVALDGGMTVQLLSEQGDRSDDRA